jgi:hypothetical protein
MAGPLRYRQVMDAQASLVASVVAPMRNLKHEPKGAPGPGLTAATWVQTVRPHVRASGLAVGSVVVMTLTRFYTGFRATPQGEIDPTLVDAADLLIEGLHGNFDLDREGSWVDLLGESGDTWRVEAGYLEMDNSIYRIMDVSVPYIMTDIYPMVK